MTLPKSTREVLEDALAADFDDRTTHAAYADILIEEGDPRGEYIHLKLILEDPDRPSSVREHANQQAASLYLRHEQEWLGSLASLLSPPRRRFTPDPEESNVDIRPRRGWVSAIEIIDVRDDHLRILADAPEARMVQELILRQTIGATPTPDLNRLATSPYFTTLRMLQIGDARTPYCTATGEGAAELVAKNSHLRRLLLFAQNTDTTSIFAIPLTQLRELRVVFASDYPLIPLAENRSLSQLEMLWLDPRSEYLPTTEEDAEASFRSPTTREEIDALFAAPQLRNITRLTLRLTGVGDWAAEAIVRHGWLERLERLDLCQTGLSDAGAELLAGCPHLPRLKQLDVQGNRLTDHGINALERADIRLHARYQEGGFGGGPDGDEGVYGVGGTDIEIVDM